MGFILSSCTLNVKTACKSYCHQGQGLTYETSSYSLDTNQDKIEILGLNRTDEAIQSCDIQPLLPEGLTLTPQCSISGKALAASSNMTYTITGRTKNYILQANIQIEIKVNGTIPLFDKSFLFFVGNDVTESLSSVGSGQASQCKITPNLPIGLYLDDQCQVSGMPMMGFDERIFELKYLYTGKLKVEKLQLKVIDPKNSNILFLADARQALGNGPLVNQCQSGNYTKISDLSGKNPFLKLNTYNTDNFCASWTSPSGTASDPYTFYSFPESTTSIVMPNPIDYNFSKESSTIISFFKILDTRNFNINMEFKSASTDCQNASFLIYVEKAIYAGDQDQIIFRKRKCTGLSEDLSTIAAYTTDGWHQFALVTNAAENKTEYYMDGKLIGTTEFMTMEASLTTSKFTAGTTSAALGYTAVYKGKMSAADIFQQCQYFQKTYAGLFCQDTFYSLNLNFYDFRTTYTNECQPVRWALVNDRGMLATGFPTGSSQLDQNGNLVFKFNSTAGTIHSQSNCDGPSQLTDIIVPNGSPVQGTLYYKSTLNTKERAVASIQSVQAGFTKGIQTHTINYPSPVAMTFYPTDDCTKTTVQVNLMGYLPDHTLTQTSVLYDIVVQVTDGVSTYQKIIHDVDSITGPTPDGLGLNKTYTLSIVSPASLATAINPTLANNGVFTTRNFVSSCGED